MTEYRNCKKNCFSTIKYVLIHISAKSHPQLSARSHPQSRLDLAERWMRSSREVRASDSQCQSRNCPGFDPSILRHSGIWGAADETVLDKVLKNPKKSLKKKFTWKKFIFLNVCKMYILYVLGYFSIIISSLWINIRGAERSEEQEIKMEKNSSWGKCVCIKYNGKCLGST